MFRTERPWLAAYERGNVEPETRVFEGSLYDLFRHAVEEHRGRNALGFYGTTFEFGRLQALVEKMAASLSAAGVSKGDRVALMLPNCTQYVISFFATVRLGAIVTQINPMYVEREISHILNDSGAETIVASSSSVSSRAGSSRHAWSSATMSGIEAKRSDGSFAIARSTADTTRSGTSGRSTRMSGTGSCTCRVATARKLSPSNGTSPVSSSNSTTPSE